MTARRPTPSRPRPRGRPAPRTQGHVQARPQPRAEQLALFPEAVEVRPLDPRAVAGAGTRVHGVWLVRFERDPAPHRVFADRHGWYCDEHGPRCRAVATARDTAGPGSSQTPSQ